MTHHFPEFGFVRLKQILAIIPIGKSTWWRGVKEGRFPKPIKLSARTTVWRAEDIRRLVEEISLSAFIGRLSVHPSNQPSAASF